MEQVSKWLEINEFEPNFAECINGVGIVPGIAFEQYKRSKQNELTSSVVILVQSTSNSVGDVDSSLCRQLDSGLGRSSPSRNVSVSQRLVSHHSGERFCYLNRSFQYCSCR
jgi:hypothetical protein